MSGYRPDLSLLCRVQRRLYAVPLAHVVETMRPLPIEAIAGAPSFVLGVAVIRGQPVPVVDLAWIGYNGAATPPTRFVMTGGGARRVALAVDEVQGVRPIAPGAMQALPPLLQGGALDVAAAIGTLDSDLLLVLRCTRLVPDDVWAGLDARGAPS